MAWFLKELFSNKFKKIANDFLLTSSIIALQARTQFCCLGILHAKCSMKKTINIQFTNPLSLLTLSLLGYLKTRICWSHVWCPNMTNDTSLESSCALLLESAKKFSNLQKLIFYRKIQLYSKMFAKKNFVQKMKNYTFLKIPWPCHFKYAKIFAKF